MGEDEKAEGGDGAVGTPEPYPLGFVKAYYFISFCYFATFYRFLTLYFEHDGLSADQIGMLWSVHRICTTISTPFWAALADKTKRARTLVQMSLVVSVLPFLCLALPVPKGLRMPARAAALWIFGLCSSPQAALRDSLAIAASAGDSDRWGKARVYGAIGWGLMHFMMGPLLDHFGFNVAFGAFIFFSCILFCVTRSSVPEACGRVRTDVTARAVLDVFAKNRIFFLNMGAIGAGMSMVEGMLFLLLKEMQASTMLCGLSVVVTVIFELPIFRHAQWFMDNVGAPRMILLAQLAWVVRAWFYAHMETAWTVLLIEPLHGVTFALVWTAATQYVADPAFSGKGLEASAQGLLNVCFMGIGPIMGLSIGGYLFEHLGSHAVYKVFCLIVAGSGLLYLMCCEDKAVVYVVQHDEPNGNTIGRTFSFGDGEGIDDLDELSGLKSSDKMDQDGLHSSTSVSLPAPSESAEAI